MLDLTDVMINQSLLNEDSTLYVFKNTKLKYFLIVQEVICEVKADC